MIKVRMLLLIILISSCKKNNFKKEYYSDGTLKSRFQVNKKGLPNGIYEEYYIDSGSLKIKTKYIDGTINDTVFGFDKSGKIKEKGLVKNGLKIGWWNYYNSTGSLKSKNEYLVLEDSIYKNQSIYFNKKGNIDYDLSSFFNINILDTLNLGWNSGKIQYYSNFKLNKKLLDVIIENEYSDIGVKKDTFGIDVNNPYFGIFANKLGEKKIKGIILETLFYKERIKKDSFQLTIKTHKKYFEKTFYVKDGNGSD